MSKKIGVAAALVISTILGLTEIRDRSDDSDKNLTPDTSGTVEGKVTQSLHHQAPLDASIIDQSSSLRESIASCLGLALEDMPVTLASGSDDWKLPVLLEDEQCDYGRDYLAWKRLYEEMNAKLLREYESLSDSGVMKSSMEALFHKVQELYEGDGELILLQDSDLIQDGIKTQEFVLKVEDQGKEYNVQLYPSISLVNANLTNPHFIWKARVACLGGRCRVGDVINIIGEDIEELAANLSGYLSNLL